MIKVIYADINFQEFKLRFKKERFTIGIVKLPIVKRSVPKEFLTIH